MSKKRIVVSIALNSLLLLVLMRATVNLLVISAIDSADYWNKFFDMIIRAENIIPMILSIITLFYIISLFHSLISKNDTARWINVLRLIFSASQIVIALIALCVISPYNGEFRFLNPTYGKEYSLDYYLFIAIPLLTLISFIPTRNEYSAFGLLYGNIVVVLYLAIIIILYVTNIIALPVDYKFMDVLVQGYYKPIINMVIIIAGTTMVSGILMLMSRPRGEQI